jgi:RNA recognition motif-containing protein
MNIYVGNLSRQTSPDELRSAFEAHGQVANINIITDKYTGDSRGFAFVEMPTQAEAEAAITNLNGTELNGRTLNVNEARSREQGGGGGGGGRGGRSGGGGGGGGRGGDRRRFGDSGGGNRDTRRW